MKNNVYIFDLQNTLVNTSGTLMIDQNDIRKLMERGDVVLYSIAEPWTFQTLQTFSQLFDGFSLILLVKTKRTDDLREFKDRYKNVVVIGDGKKTEIAIAATLRYEALLVDQEESSTSRLIKRLLEVQT